MSTKVEEWAYLLLYNFAEDVKCIFRLSFQAKCTFAFYKHLKRDKKKNHDDGKQHFLFEVFLCSKSNFEFVLYRNNILSVLKICGFTYTNTIVSKIAFEFNFSFSS